MNIRYAGFLGIGAWILFWLSSVVFAELRPSYSHVVNTISELGALGTPNATLWNITGFIIPGVLLAIVGATIARTVNTKPSLSRVLTTILMVLSGLAIAGQGLMPAEMINGVADITSAFTQRHFVSSLISGFAWGVGALLLTGHMKRDLDWQSLYIVNVVLVVLTLGSSFVLRGILPAGLSQRAGNAIFCAWFVIMSMKLIQIGSRTDRTDAAV